MKASCAKPSPVKHPAPDKTKQKQLPAGVQLVCGKTVSTFRRREFTQEDLPAEPIVLARLELDLSHYCQPLVSLDFYTMIEVRDTCRAGESQTIGSALTFTLFKNCNGNKQILRTYEYVVNIVLVSDGDKYNIRDSFYFLYCDEHACHQDCCVYTVELTNIEVLDPEANEEDENRLQELTIEDPVLKAIIQETAKLHAGGVK
ncbi:MAG: DUF4489 domain-containing protein [Dethiobacteraceae bacterium]|nr:DUF4489 domain-containing protein [Bacillota bacterium]